MSRDRALGHVGQLGLLARSARRRRRRGDRTPRGRAASSCPSRFAPCTLTQAHSPAAYRPGIGISSGADHDPAVEVGRDAAHRVVRGGLDRHRFLRGLDLQVDARELGDVGQLLLDHLRVEVRDVEVGPVVVGAGAAAFLDLLVDRAAHHVARREVLDRGGVALHEPFAVLVEHDAALAARGLGQAAPRACARPVGWNWNISMSSSGTPRRHATAGPSPVSAWAFEVTRNMRP